MNTHSNEIAVLSMHGSMSQLAYRKHLQRQVVFGAQILKQRAVETAGMCG